MRKKIIMLLVFTFVLFNIPKSILAEEANCNVKIDYKGNNVILSWNCSSGKIKAGRIYEADASCTNVDVSTAVYSWGKDYANYEFDITSYLKPGKTYLVSLSPGKGITPYNKCFDSNSESGGTTKKGTAKSDYVPDITTISTKKAEEGPDHPDLSTMATRTIGDSTNICTEEVKDKVHYYWNYIMILAPIALMILISADFVKAITSGKPDALQKSGNDAVKRTIACVILLMIPFLLSTIFSWFGMDICF